MAEKEYYGSRIIMLESLIRSITVCSKNKTLTRCKKFVFDVFEPDRENQRLLEKAIKEFEPRMNSLPTNVSIEIHPANLKTSATAELRIMLSVHLLTIMNQATFLFVDPFGLTGYLLELLARLCQPTKCNNVERSEERRVGK